MKKFNYLAIWQNGKATRHKMTRTQAKAFEVIYNAVLILLA